MKILKTKQQVQRRNFLKASAGVATMPASAIGLNVLSTQAMATTNSAIKRVVFVYAPFGALPGTHLFDNAELLEGCEPLEDHKENIIFFENCYTNTQQYGTNGLLGLREGGTTIDVAIGNILDPETLISSLHLGVETGYLSVSYDGDNPVTQQNNPVTAFNDVLSTTTDRADFYKHSVSPLEYNLEELAKIKQKSSHDTNKVQQIEEFENSIQSIINRSKSVPGALCDNQNQDTYNWDNELTNNFTTIANIHCDTIATAFKCNITKVATLQLGTPDSSQQPRLSELNNDEMYSITHTSTAHYLDYSRYLNERLSYLINNLKNTNDENGQPLFESTLVLKVTDFGNADAHDSVNAPFMMAAGSNIFEGQRNVKAKDNYELLDTVTQALGLSDQIDMLGTTTVDNLFK